jgi:hypothetical protein
MPAHSENKSIVNEYKKPRPRIKYARYDMDAPENTPKYCKYEDPRECREDFSGIDYVDDEAYLTSVHQTQKMFRLVHPGIIYYCSFNNYLFILFSEWFSDDVRLRAIIDILRANRDDDYTFHKPPIVDSDTRKEYVNCCVFVYDVFMAGRRCISMNQKSKLTSAKSKKRSLRKRRARPSLPKSKIG